MSIAKSSRSSMRALNRRSLLGDVRPASTTAQNSFKSTTSDTRRQVASAGSQRGQIPQDGASNTDTDDSAVSASKCEEDVGKSATKQGPAKKTMAEMDEELRMKMEGRAGDGGEAGMELEDGKPVAMKRGTRSNMFRLI